jgi:hypothetical protein
MPLRRRDLAGSLLLVTLALAGLLSMHGFDGAVASLAGPSHIAAEEGTGHDALSICVFVLAIAGLGMAILASSPRGRVTGRYPGATDSVPGHPVPGAGGRSRLTLLCVLRL